MVGHFQRLQATKVKESRPKVSSRVSERVRRTLLKLWLNNISGVPENNNGDNGTAGDWLHHRARRR